MSIMMRSIGAEMGPMILKPLSCTSSLASFKPSVPLFSSIQNLNMSYFSSLGSSNIPSLLNRSVVPLSSREFHSSIVPNPTGKSVSTSEKGSKSLKGVSVLNYTNKEGTYISLVLLPRKGMTKEMIEDLLTLLKGKCPVLDAITIRKFETPLFSSNLKIIEKPDLEALQKSDVYQMREISLDDKEYFDAVVSKILAVHKKSTVYFTLSNKDSFLFEKEDCVIFT